ncbi:glucose-specific phosphotransferase system IIA component [Lactobacillus colini]|uniref:Glucose-specific phosphotransferase system IIA component n=1 Tax=Lactobacillus colini TaxID=1819254 RepID=A0ABS4MEW4_9LACO|nr:PTS glucose transporter subunit IIA [Lactobacillus colini]MBP2058230.1 glucose-specific phosphotransferase system IIA component [Lactobacillus colini]
MLAFLKKLKSDPNEVVAPANGTLIDLSTVSDPVFAQKMMGDGFAIKPDVSSGTIEIFAPVSGKIVSLPATKHAVGIHTKAGKDILVHIGIDTVDLKGDGFEAFAQQGDQVNRGDKLISVDAQKLKDAKLDNTIMVIFTGETDKQLNFDIGYNNEVKSKEKLM